MMLTRRQRDALKMALPPMLSLAAAGAAFGQQPARPALHPTRADLAFAYLEVDRLFAAKERPTDVVASVNRQFDRASQAFITGASLESLEKIEDIVGDLSGDAAAASRAARVARSLGARIEPAVYIRNSGAALKATVGAMYAVAPGAEGAGDAGAGQTWLTLAAYRVESPDRPAKAFYSEFAFPTGGAADASVTIDLAPALLKDAAEGTYAVVLVGPGQSRRVGRWMIADRSLDTAREANAAALETEKPAHGALVQAAQIAGARNQLLTDHPSMEDSAQFLADLPRLAHEVEAEIGAIAKGENPYAERRGDWWGVVTVDSVTVPFRMYAPATLKAGVGAGDGSSVPPLVIALHGAGGDESLFMEGYGRGEIKTLADRHGFIVVSPRSSPFLASAAAFDAIVEQVGALYRFDHDRIYVVGHSLGGGVAAAWARTRREKVAAACAIAGISTFKAGESIAPFLAIAAELDSLSPVAQVRRKNEDAIKGLAAAGELPVEFREVKGYGHTLVVGKCLPEAVEWLMARALKGEVSR